MTHLPEKSGLACAARLAAAPNISTTATIRKFRRIIFPFLNVATAVAPDAVRASNHTFTVCGGTLREH
jgi:hypothetical protein